MCDEIVHRGPDAEGLYIDEKVGLGHRRLSIIDLSENANQPLCIEEFVLVYNGEIYNYLELRSELEKQHRIQFKTQSDSEVIVRAYQVYGNACVKKFNGMFAFFLWNKITQTAIVARDRLGVKPLFYGKNDQGYFFASDLKSLWHVFPPSELCLNAVQDYFSYGFISTMETSTKGIKKFPPAMLLELKEENETWAPYWNLNDVYEVPMSFNEAVDQTTTLLKSAIQLRLRSDVPVGTFLSGGIDSSLITAMAVDQFGLRPHTFSIGFDSKEMDETRFAYQVANKYHTTHQHQILDHTCLNVLPDIVWKYSELFGDSSSLPSYWVSKIAAERLKVVLTGDGGDEAFGGYVTPFSFYLSRMVRGIPGGIRQLGKSLPNISLFRRIKKLNELSFLDVQDAYTKLLKSGGFSMWPEAFVRLPNAGNELAQQIVRCNRKGVDAIFYMDIENQLTYDFLVKVDMATMAHSLEARSPFLDYRLMEYGYSLPAAIKFHDFQRKAILKKIAGSYFSKSFIYRKKQGFSIPVYKWLRSDHWFPVIERIIQRPSLLAEILTKESVNQVIEEFKHGKGNHGTRIWLLLWFQLWEGLIISKLYTPTMKLEEL